MKFHLVQVSVCCQVLMMAASKFDLVEMFACFQKHKVAEAKFDLMEVVLALGNLGHCGLCLAATRYGRYSA